MVDTYKKWTFALIAFLLALITVNFAIWKGFTEDILTFDKWYNGGLDRMGYIVGSKHYRKPESTLPRRHIENSEYEGQPVDVITIGDSFSNTYANGRDPLYQDWIASLYGLNVMNIQPLKGLDKLSTLIVLLNSGYLDKVRPRAVIFESVERYCAVVYAKTMNFGIRMPLEKIEDYYRQAAYRSEPPRPAFINTGNFKFILYSILYKFSDHAFFSQVCVRDLNAPLFSVKNDRRLLFFHEDVSLIPAATPDRVKLLNENLNRLAVLLKKKGIVLYFMPAADKYNVYSDYIIDNPYPKSVFFELLRKEPRDYVLVDTKALLLEEVRKGEKDIYYADDTHWSWKAVKKIAENMILPPASGDRPDRQRKDLASNEQFERSR